LTHANRAAATYAYLVEHYTCLRLPSSLVVILISCLAPARDVGAVRHDIAALQAGHASSGGTLPSICSSPHARRRFSRVAADVLRLRPIVTARCDSNTAGARRAHRHVATCLTRARAWLPHRVSSHPVLRAVPRAPHGWLRPYVRRCTAAHDRRGDADSRTTYPFAARAGRGALNRHAHCAWHIAPTRDPTPYTPTGPTPTPPHPPHG